MNALAALAAELDGEIEFDTALARFTTYRIGGPAAALVFPASVEDVVRVVRFARASGTPCLALGLGSNVLIADEGFDGIVVRLGKGLDRVTQAVGNEATVWHVGAGLPTPRLARRSARAGLGGVHRLVGVPGTVGGGVFMNAGAHGQDFSQVVRAVDVVSAGGEVRQLLRGEIAWRYRASGLRDAVVVAATVELQPQDPTVLEREIRQHFRWRKAGTPFDEPCCGSVFRNPTPPASAPGEPQGANDTAGDRPRSAGQLIDACGLKGFRIGDAQVSPKHANYIVNVGRATAAEVLAVIDHVRERVFQEFGIELALEVKVIGKQGMGSQEL